MAAKERPARAQLKAWVGVPGRTQGKLADAVGVTQQTISRLLDKGEPSRDLARLLEAATGIEWRGWFTRRQLERWEKQEARARKLGALLGGGRDVSPTAG